MKKYSTIENIGYWVVTLGFLGMAVLSFMAAYKGLLWACGINF